MKKITLFFFTFSGIYTGFAQNPAEISDSVNVKQKSAQNVLLIKVDSSLVKEKASFQLYPNPAKNKVEIEIKHFNPGYVQLQLIDKNGNLLRNDKRLVFSGNETIIFMFSEKPGLYFLLLKQGNKNLRSKLVIQ